MHLTVVSQRAPTPEDETTPLRLVGGEIVKSNAIVLVRGNQVVGVGAGQMNRVGSVEIAVKQAGERAVGP